MTIPKSVQLMGHRVSVQVFAHEDWKLKTEACGIYYPDVHEIHLIENPPSELEHAFYHELTHAILDMLSYDKLYGDEQFVDSFSGLLHQALKTAVYK